MNRSDKSAFVEELGSSLQRADLVLLTDFTGVDVEGMNSLRRKLDGVDDVELRVVKNTLCARAIAGTDLEPLLEHLTGPTAVLLGYSDPVSPAKVLNDFMKENKKLKVKSGFYGGKVIEPDAVKALASMPSRETLLGQLLGTLQAPMSNFVGVLAAVPQQIVGVLAAYKDKLEESA